MDDLARFCCQNPDCPPYGRRDAANPSVCDRYGKHRQIRLLYGNACKDRFSERKGTPLFHSHLPEDKARSVLQHLSSPRAAASDRPGVSSMSTAIPSFAWPNWPDNTPTTRMTRSWLFPPATREVQFDEIRAFVGKKQKNCDPADPGGDHKGDWWDHVAFDPEHKRVLAVVPGARVTEGVEEVVTEVKDRLDERSPAHLTSDEYPVYETVIEAVFSTPVVAPPGPARPGRPPLLPERRLDPGVTYATVRKERENNRVVAVRRTVVLGSQPAVDAALRASVCSRTINTSFVERQHATARGQNARQSRRTYRFSKDWEVHESMSYFTRYRYNFCWPVRTLRVRDAEGRWQERTPAMSAGLADHVWSLDEWRNFPAVQRN